MELEIDFSGVNDYKSLHERLKHKLRYSEDMGANGYALIDCLRSLRRPEDELVGISLEEEEILTIKLRYFPVTNRLVTIPFLEVIKVVNQDFIKRGELPVIALVFM
jgi:RNAse (barnase) inhibitor barstar